MQVPDHTVIGLVHCDACGFKFENTGEPGTLLVGQCPCPRVHGSIARPITPGEDEGDIRIEET